MERFNRLAVVHTVLLLSGLGTLPSRAQAPSSEPKAAPVADAPDSPKPAKPSRKPPAEPGELRLPINLAAALRLADAPPLIVAAAQAGSWVAEAKLQKTKLSEVPTLNRGGFRLALSEANFFFQPEPGGPLLPTPQMLRSTDKIFQPLRERQAVHSSREDSQTAKNDALLQTARAYFNVHKNRGIYAGSLDVVRKGRNLVEVLDHLSPDLVSRVEVDRARNFLAFLEQQAVSARKDWRVANADLIHVLRLEPRVVVVPLEHDHLQLTLIDPERSLDDLIPIGLTNRPELASHQAAVQATLAALRREALKPSRLPSGLLNGFQKANELLQLGVGGGMNIWHYRDDIGLIAQSMGLEDLEAIKEQSGKIPQALVALFKIEDKVATDVTRAQAHLLSAAARVVQAQRALRGALANYNGNVEGLGQTKRVGNVLEMNCRPQEAVFCLKLLAMAYKEYFATVAECNQAQFQLLHALGYPLGEISLFRRPSQVEKVDTTRPGYPPPVGTGPPPQTR